MAAENPVGSPSAQRSLLGVCGGLVGDPRADTCQADPKGSR
jgi:hypothetical protein